MTSFRIQRKKRIYAKKAIETAAPYEQHRIKEVFIKFFYKGVCYEETRNENLSH